MPLPPLGYPLPSIRRQPAVVAACAWRSGVPQRRPALKAAALWVPWELGRPGVRRREAPFCPESCFEDEPEPVDFGVPEAELPERFWLPRRLRRRGLAAFPDRDSEAAAAMPSNGPESTRIPGASSANIGCVAPLIRVVIGAMPAARVSNRTSCACSLVMIVTTVPALPARAVRPERCWYALCSAGGSA